MNQWREASAETNEKTTVWIKTKQKRLSRSVLLIKHTPLQLYRRCCRGNNTRVKREQAWCKHTHAALWLALSIIDQPWGQHTWRRGRRRETRVFLAVSSAFTFRCVHHVDYLCRTSTFDLWPLTSSLSAAFSVVDVAASITRWRNSFSHNPFKNKLTLEGCRQVPSDRSALIGWFKHQGGGAKHFDCRRVPWY